MGNWAQLYADLTAQAQAGQPLSFWDNAFVGFYQSFFAAGRWKLYLDGLLTTLEATILALLLGVALGMIVAVVRTAHDQQRAGHKNVILGVFNAICKIYTTVIRGTPMMVQLLIMSLVVFASSRNYTMIGILTLGINSGGRSWPDGGRAQPRSELLHDHALCRHSAGGQEHPARARQ